MTRLYGSIPHLPGSRVAADRALSPSQARRCLDAAATRAEEEVLVQEKLDGSCVAIVRGPAGALEARGREGRLAAESQNIGRQMFAAWVEENRERLEPLVGEGEVLAGEWLALVHGTRYELPHELFVPFDLLRGSARTRAGYDELRERVAPSGLALPALLHRGAPIAIDVACNLLGERGRHGALDPPEGLVYRVEKRAPERRSRGAGQDGEHGEHGSRAVVLIAKWVRPDKIDGAFLPENSGREALYHRGCR